MMLICSSTVEYSLVLEYQYCIEAQIILGDCMSTIQNVWQSIETQYTNGTFPVDQLEKIDVLVFSEDIENKKTLYWFKV